MADYTRDWRGRGAGHTSVVARPEDTAQMSKLMALCHHHGVAVTPQGGNTGVVRGGLPFGEVLVSTRRMKKVRTIDPVNDSITVEAGVTLADVQQQAETAQRLFPLSLASESQATIGGLISTNAGGTAVLRYGMMRDLVLGIEAVMPDGRIWNGLTGLRKDNTAYDLKQFFIGAEGTLGVVTAATLKLFPRPALSSVSWLAVDSPEAAAELLGLAKSMTGGAVSTFELMGQNCIQQVMASFPALKDPHRMQARNGAC